MPNRGKQREETFQAKVDKWMLACFGQKVLSDSTIINPIFLEEVLELCRVNGMTQEEVHKTVDYIFSLDMDILGSMSQEVGGVMVTLAALSGATREDMVGAGLVELARNWKNLDKIKLRLYNKAVEAHMAGFQPQTVFCAHEFKVSIDAFNLLNMHLGLLTCFYEGNNGGCVIDTVELNHLVEEGTEVGATLSVSVLKESGIDVIKLASGNVKYIEVSVEG